MAVVTVDAMADAMADVQAAAGTARHAAHVMAKRAAVVAVKVVAVKVAVVKVAVAETANAVTAVAGKAVAGVTANVAKPPKPAARSGPKSRPAKSVNRANHANHVKCAHHATANAVAVVVRAATARLASRRPTRSKTAPTPIRSPHPSHRQTTLPPGR